MKTTKKPAQQLKDGTKLPAPTKPIHGVIDTTKKSPTPPKGPIPLGLSIMPDTSENVTFDGISLRFSEATTLGQWESVGLAMAQAQKMSQWCLGDWLNFGTGHFKKEYKAAMAKTGLAYGTLRTAASIAKRFPAGKRREAVSFEHHRLLAPVKDETQVALLMDRVEKESLSAKAMKEIIPTQTPAALTPAQQQAKNLAESSRMKEHAEGLLKYLSELPQHKEKHTMFAGWADILKRMAGLNYARLATIQKEALAAEKATNTAKLDAEAKARLAAGK